MRVVVVTPPDPVVSLQEAKAHIGVDYGNDDALIVGMIAAATAHIDGPDGWLGRAIGEQVLESYQPGIDGEDLSSLPCPPIVELISIDRRCGANWVPVDLSVYELRGASIWVSAARGRVDWSDDPEAARIRYRAGYAQLPYPIRAAILLMTADLYDGRNPEEAKANSTVDRLLAPYRVWR